MVFIISYLLSFLMFLLTFLIARAKEKHDLIDILWGLSFIVPSVLSLILSASFNMANITMTALVFIWGFRLSYYIFLRNAKSKEDFRYVKYREEYKGKHFDLYFFFKMYIFQYVLSIIISFQVVYSNVMGIEGFGYLAILGLFIWNLGYFFESEGDKQLKDFKADKANKGKIMTGGLWQYTRHPNYFGEATMWWGVYLIAISNYENFFLIFSPIVITILVRFVSGVPLLEKKYDERTNWVEKENWEEYKRRTSIFFPMPKKK